MHTVHGVSQKCSKRIILNKMSVNGYPKRAFPCYFTVNKVCLRHCCYICEHYQNKDRFCGCENVSRRFLQFYARRKQCSLLDCNTCYQCTQISTVIEFSETAISLLHNDLAKINSIGESQKRESLSVTSFTSSNNSKRVESITSIDTQKAELPITNNHETRYSVNDDSSNKDNDDDEDDDDFLLKEYEQLVLNAQTSFDSEQRKDDVEIEYTKDEHQSRVIGKVETIQKETNIQRGNEDVNSIKLEEIEQLLEETISALPNNCAFVKLTEFSLKINTELIYEQFGSVLNFLQRFPAHFECEKVTDVHGARWFVKRRRFTEFKKSESEKEEALSLPNSSKSSVSNYNIITTKSSSCDSCGNTNVSEWNIVNKSKDDIITAENAELELREELQWQEEQYNSEILLASRVNYDVEKRATKLQKRGMSVVTEENKNHLQSAIKNEQNELKVQVKKNYISNIDRNNYERSVKDSGQIECEQKLHKHRRQAIQNLFNQLDICDETWNELSSLLPLDISIPFVQFKRNLNKAIHILCATEKRVNVSELEVLSVAVSSSSSSSLRLTKCEENAQIDETELSCREIANRTNGNYRISSATINMLNSWPSGVLRLIHTYYKNASPFLELSSDSTRIARTGVLSSEKYKLWNPITYDANDVCKGENLQTVTRDGEEENMKNDKMILNKKLGKGSFSNVNEQTQESFTSFNLNGGDINDNDNDDDENFFGVDFEENVYCQKDSISPSTFNHLREEHQNGLEKERLHESKDERMSQHAIFELSAVEQKNSTPKCKEQALSKKVLLEHSTQDQEENDTDTIDNTLFVPSTQLGSLGRKSVLYKGPENENNASCKMMNGDSDELPLAHRGSIVRESIGQLDWALLASAPQIVHKVKESTQYNTAINEKNSLATNDLNMQINSNVHLHSNLQSHEYREKLLKSQADSQQEREFKEEEEQEETVKKDQILTKRLKSEVTLTPEELERRHTIIAIEKGWRTPRELLELFVECIPTFYIPIRKLVISDVLAHTLGPRNALGTVIRIYNYFFQTIITPDRTKMVRLHESLVHPHRGMANKLYEECRLANEQSNMPATNLDEAEPKKIERCEEKCEYQNRENSLQGQTEWTNERQSEEKVISANTDKKENTLLQRKCSKLTLERSANTQKFPILQTVIKSKVKLQPLSEKSKPHTLDKSINVELSREIRNTEQTIRSARTKENAFQRCDYTLLPEVMVNEQKRTVASELPKQSDTSQISVRSTSDMFSFLEESNELKQIESSDISNTATLPLFLRAALKLPYERFITVKQAAELCECTLPQMYNLASPNVESQAKYALLLSIADESTGNNNKNRNDIKNKANAKPQLVRLRPLLLAPDSTNNLNVEELPEELIKLIRPTWIPLQKIIHRLSAKSIEQLIELLRPLQVNKCGYYRNVDEVIDMHSGQENVDLQSVANLLRMYGSVCWLSNDKMHIRKFTNNADLDDIVHLSILFIRHACSHNYECLNDVLDRLTRQIVNYQKLHEKNENEVIKENLLNERHGLLHMLQSAPKQSLIKVLQQHTKLFEVKSEIFKNDSKDLMLKRRSCL